MMGLTGLKSFIFLDSVSSEKFPSTLISSAILFEYQRQSMWGLSINITDRFIFGLRGFRSKKCPEDSDSHWICHMNIWWTLFIKYKKEKSLHLSFHLKRISFFFKFYFVTLWSTRFEVSKIGVIRLRWQLFSIEHCVAKLALKSFTRHYYSCILCIILRTNPTIPATCTLLWTAVLQGINCIYRPDLQYCAW